MKRNLPSNPNVNITFDKNNLKEIYYAGGCFWGVEAYFSRVPGVYDAVSGYANGITENPSYEEVCTGETKHAETVYVKYDPAIISLLDLTEHFFGIINPTYVNRQGNDKGSQYRSGIYFVDEEDVETIKAVVQKEQEKWLEPIATEVMGLHSFYLAEEYHQDYLEKNPNGYCHVNFDRLRE